jgi:hypothetical protein
LALVLIVLLLRMLTLGFLLVSQAGPILSLDWR